ncbi:MAG: hypothetical protein KKH98_01650 [Spirochaetes bacterium]|nr:hypothetical protein [Spirochaetota bacterium]
MRYLNKSWFILIILVMNLSLNLNAQILPINKKTVVTEPAVKQDKILYNDGKTDYATSQNSYILSGTDLLSDIKSLKYKVDNGDYVDYKSPVSIKDEGLHTIKYYSEDNVGNKTPEGSYAVIIDNTPPDVLVGSSVKLFSLKGKEYAPASAEFTIKASDTAAGVKLTEYSLDTSGYTPYSSGIKMSATGVHTLKYRSIDNLNNSSAEKEFVVFTDNTKPLVKIIPSGDLYTKANINFAPPSFQYSIEAIDLESQIAKVMVSVDDGKYGAYGNPLVLSKEGVHTIKAQAVDNVGNESAEVSLTFTVDSTPPKIELQPSK